MMQSFTRRNLLRQMMMGGLGAAAAASGQMALMRSALAASSSVDSDYKALVCVFLYGGNDSWNMLLPMAGDARVRYEDARQNLAATATVASRLGNGIEGGLGLHPAMSRLNALVDAGKLALQTNVGPLIVPTTYDQFRNNAVPVPEQLFSHNDQQATWMRGAEAKDMSFGWAGRMLELLDDTGGFTRNFTLAGNNLWQSSINGNPFTLSQEGVPEINGFEGDWWGPMLRKRVHAQMQALADHPLERMAAQVTNNAVVNAKFVRDALAMAPNTETEFTPGNHLSGQLKAIARLITVQPHLKPKRQVFFVGLGGWDTHDEQNQLHSELLEGLANGLADFQAELDAFGVGHQVTTFTMSDFARTLSSNGDGTDHAWGGHQFIMGGAVNGGRLYGELPRQALDNGVDIGGGRMIPTTANEQMFASLASWMGLSASEIADIMPAIGAFDTPPNYFV